MKIVFIGSNGFLATSLGNFYSTLSDTEVIVLGRNAPRHYTYYQYYKFSIDINTSIDIALLLQADVILYLAASGVQSSAMYSLAELNYVNTEFPIKVVKLLEQHLFNGIFVSFGSYFEIGENNKEQRFSEFDILMSNLPLPNDYCKSKKKLTQHIAFSNMKCKHLHFVLPTIFGPQEDQNRLIPYILKHIKNEQDICLTNGAQFREYLSSTDLCRIVHSMITQHNESGIFNIEGNIKLTIRELALSILKEFNYPTNRVTFSSLERPDTTMKYLSLNGDKLKKKLPVLPQEDLITVIKSYVII